MAKKFVDENISNLFTPTTMDLIISKKKSCFSNRRPSAKDGEVYDFNGIKLYIVEVWYGTYGFACMRLFKLEGFETQKEYAKYMESIFKKIKPNDIMYHHHFIMLDSPKSIDEKIVDDKDEAITL